MPSTYNNSILSFANATPGVTQEYRRNGKLQSCEPCRKSKLRCDHVLPTCGRCVKRRRVDQCVYHPAPLTQKRPRLAQSFPSPPSTGSATIPDVAESVEPLLENAVLHQEQAIDPLPFTIIRRQRARAASAPIALEDKRISTAGGNPGFLGSTSYSAVFEEGLDHLDVSIDDLQARAEVEAAPALEAEKLLRGAKVLSIFQDSLLVNQFINKGHEIMNYAGEFVICPMMKHWLKELWLHHRDTLRDQKPDKIRKLCEQIWRNTQTPLEFDGSISPKDWASLSTGHNLRWEVVGLIVAEMGLAAGCLSNLDDMFRPFSTTRDALLKRLYEGVQACLDFCRACEARGDLFMWFLNSACNFTGAVKGPESYIAYQQTGEFINAMIARGFQQEIKANANIPFFLSELRKRNRISCYGQEVALGSLLGRPPRLSHRYTSLQLPLHLTDAELWTGPAELGPILAKLDDKGWASGDKWQRATYMRANMIHAPRREDILDISLGNYTKEEILERIAEIRRRYAEVWDEAPAFIKAARDEPQRRDIPILIALYRNVVRHGYLANELLLQQVLVRKTGVPADDLIKFARLVFKDIMTLTGRHDMLKDFRLELTWLLASHGLRCAAVLAVELYKQEQLPVYPTNPRLQRAETIRELSSFVERLGVIEPTDAMHAFCDQGRRVISCILDKILAPPRVPTMDITAPPISTQTAPILHNFGDGGIGDFASMDFGGLNASLNLGNDAEFMQWLDNMDWEKQA